MTSELGMASVTGGPSRPPPAEAPREGVEEMPAPLPSAEAAQLLEQWCLVLSGQGVRPPLQTPPPVQEFLARALQGRDVSPGERQRLAEALALQHQYTGRE